MKIRLQNRHKAFLKQHAFKKKLGTMRAAMDDVLVAAGCPAAPPRLTAKEKAEQTKKFLKEQKAKEAEAADRKAKEAEAKAKADREAADKLLKETEATRKDQAKKDAEDKEAKEKAQRQMASDFEKRSTARGRKELAKEGKLEPQAKGKNQIMARIKPHGESLSIAFDAPDVGYGAGVSAWQLLPVFQQDEYFNQLVYELVSGGTGQFEITNAPLEDVEAEIASPGSQANVVATAWNAGLVDQGALSEPTIEISPPPTAWRMQATVTTVVGNVRATA